MFSFYPVPIYRPNITTSGINQSPHGAASITTFRASASASKMLLRLLIKLQPYDYPNSNPNVMPLQRRSRCPNAVAMQLHPISSHLIPYLCSYNVVMCSSRVSRICDIPIQVSVTDAGWWIDLYIFSHVRDTGCGATDSHARL